MNRHAATFTRAMEAAGVSNAKIIEEVGGTITPANVSHWRHGRRPMPAEYAPAIAALLRVDPESISEAYARLTHAQAAAAQDVAGVAGHLAIEQLPGFVRHEGPRRILLPDFLVRPRIGTTPVAGIRWTLQPSTAMAPAIHRHALVLIDSTATDRSLITDGSVHAYTLWGRPDIRRILIRRDGWALARHANPADHTFVPTDELGEIGLFGAVLGWLDTTPPLGVL
jgi:DNA-binding transcriptional regulator YdaS (Cro superfamily)